MKYITTHENNTRKPKVKIFQVRKIYCKRSIDISLENFLQIIIQIPRVRTFIKSKITALYFLKHCFKK